MNKILLIIRREYLTRVRKKSFLVMSILGPVIFAAFLVVPTWLASVEDKEEKTIAIIDPYGYTYGVLTDSDYLKFKYLNDTSLSDVKNDFGQTGFYALLYVPENLINSSTAILYSEKQPNLATINQITGSLEQEIERLKLEAENIENLDEILKSVETNIRLVSKIWTDEGETKESMTEITMGIGYVSGFLIYFFIFLFGAMVMRGVIEEKTNRIVEVIISSVKPFQLMMGKIVGVGLVGLTQFLIWVLLTIGIANLVQERLYPDLNSTKPETSQSVDIMSSGNGAVNPEVPDMAENLDIGRQIFNSFDSIPFVFILGMFLFYFIGGFLLYGSFFAMIGSAVDSETDTQQFMLPVTIPLIIAIFVMLNTIQNPEGQIAFWFSMIPLTSPIVMMVRVPFNPPAWQLALSAIILILTFLGSVWMAGKIYRTGILMYGKKVTYRELWKWLRYKS